jgi:DNA-binding response OmpR family regulator
VNSSALQESPPGLRPPESPSRLGNLALSATRFDLEVANHYAGLTYLEFELLRLFFKYPNRILPYQFITSALFEPSEPSAMRRRLAVMVCRLRTKLCGSKPYELTTVRGRGYGLVSRELTLTPGG